MKPLLFFAVGAVFGWVACHFMNRTADEDWEDWETGPETGESQPLANYERLSLSVAPLVARYIRESGLAGVTP